MDSAAVKPCPSPNLLTSEELINELNKDSESLYSVNDLKSEFYSRFNNRLYQHCARFCSHHRLDEDVLKEVVQSTFIKALAKVKGFELERESTEKKANNFISAWLNTIARNAFMDHFKQRAKISSIDDSFEMLPADDNCAEEIEYFQEDLNLMKLQQAMDALSDRERFIILLCVEHNCLDNNKHLPDNVLKKISDKLALKKGNIRVVKSRALKKLREEFTRS